MIQDGENKKFETILFIKLDRFFRSVAEYHECMKRLGTVTWIATEEAYDLTTANGRMLVNMKLTIAELEADQTSERIKLVNEYKVKEGRALYGERALPFGYTTGIVDGKKKVVKKDEEKVKDMLQYFFNCESIGKTATYMFSKYQIKYDVVNKFFHSTIINGKYRDNPNYCEGYVNDEEWERIQRVIGRNSRYSPTKKRWYIFCGILICSECGKKMRSCQCHVTIKGKRYDYKRYICESRAKNRSCDNQRSIYESTLEKYVIAEADKRFSNPDVKATKKETVRVDNSEKIKRLNYMFETGRIPVEEYDRKYHKLVSETTTRTIAPIQLEANWKDIYSMLDDEHKNIFWKKLIDHIEMDKEKNIIIYWC